MSGKWWSCPCCLLLPPTERPEAAQWPCSYCISQSSAKAGAGIVNFCRVCVPWGSWHMGIVLLAVSISGGSGHLGTVPRLLSEAPALAGSATQLPSFSAMEEWDWICWPRHHVKPWSFSFLRVSAEMPWLPSCLPFRKQGGGGAI